MIPSLPLHVHTRFSYDDPSYRTVKYDVRFDEGLTVRDLSQAFEEQADGCLLLEPHAWMSLTGWVLNLISASTNSLLLLTSWAVKGVITSHEPDLSLL